MDVVINISFFLTRQKNLLQNNMQFSLVERMTLGFSKLVGIS
jgi:hypothetical protein